LVGEAMIQDRVTARRPGAVRSCIRALFSNRRPRWLRRAGYPIIAALLLIVPLCAHAEEKPLQIGVLALGPRNMPNWRCGPDAYRLAAAERRREILPFYVVGLLDELERLKYVEDRPDNAGTPGRRFVLDVRMGTPQEVKGFAREFAERRVDIIVAVATTAVRIAQEETKQNPIPILFPGISDPVGDGFVQSLARPGGFITGVSHQQVQGSGKRVELFKEMLPGLRRLITIRRPGYGPAEKSMAEIRAAAERLKIDILDWTADSREDLQSMLAQVRRETADGIMMLPDAFVISNTDLVIETSLEQGVPTFGLQDFMASWGALGAYGPSTFQAGGRVARYIDKISKGAKPGDLPVEPLDPIFVVNLKAAQCLGVSLPLEVLNQADRVIR
jgi:putative ABC transport system substrate-binding protein